jgi:hypothetical protein
VLGGVGDKTRMKDEGEMMNESGIRFPLFDLDFLLSTCNIQLQKIPAGERSWRASKKSMFSFLCFR